MPGLEKHLLYFSAVKVSLWFIELWIFVFGIANNNALYLSPEQGTSCFCLASWLMVLELKLR